MREIAWLGLEAELPEPEGSLLTENEFEQEASLAAAGQWEEIGLDALPENWRPATIEELRHAE